MEPRKRSTSSALYGRCTPFHRGLFAHSCSMHSWASACCAVRSSSLINDALERCWACFVPLLFVGIVIFSCEFVGERIELNWVRSSWVEFSVHDHRFTQVAGTAESFSFFLIGCCRKFAKQPIKLLVE